jgi:hypothetical protein
VSKDLTLLKADVQGQVVFTGAPGEAERIFTEKDYGPFFEVRRAWAGDV